MGTSSTKSSPYCQRRSNIRCAEGGSKAPIERILDVCNDHGALKILMDRTSDAEMESGPFQKAMIIFEMISSTVLLPSQRRWLMESITELGLKDSELQSLTIECHPEASSPDIPGKVSEIIEYLSDLPHSAESDVMHLHPALEFIERIALKAQDTNRQKVRDKLIAISEATAEFFDLTSGYLESKRTKLKQTLTEDRGRLLHVQVDLEPVDEQGKVPPDRYRVAICLWKKQGERSLFLGGETETASSGSPPPSYSKDQLCERVIKRVSELVARHRRNEDKLVIELFLPRSLRNLDSDQWEETIASGRRLKIGWNYPIVVRCRDRLRQRKLLTDPYWNLVRAAKAIRAQWAQAGAVPVEWIKDVQAADPNELFERVRPVPGKLFLALVVTPDDLKRERHDNLLQAALDAGVPLAIWLRQRAVDLLAAERELQETLLAAEHCLAELPHRICEYRSMPRKNDSSYLGNDLTLFWDDDPERVPPSVWSQGWGTLNP